MRRRFLPLLLVTVALTAGASSTTGVTPRNVDVTPTLSVNAH
ncbi:MAG TPA: hypothetical protein VF337_11865 [Candidatus Limnocylindrales bacterium]